MHHCSHHLGNCAHSWPYITCILHISLEKGEMEKRVPPSHSHDGLSQGQNSRDATDLSSVAGDVNEVFENDTEKAVVVEMDFQSPGEVVQVWRDDHQSISEKDRQDFTDVSLEGIGRGVGSSNLEGAPQGSNKQSEDCAESKLHLSVYMACVSLDSCKVSKGRSHLEGPCCCETCDRAVALSGTSPNHQRKSGSAKGIKSHRSFSEPSSSYTLVVKPRALRPLVNCDAVVRYPGSFETLHSPSAAQETSGIPWRPGSTPSHPVAVGEEETICLPYSSPNSPIPFTLTVNNNKPPREKAASRSDEEEGPAETDCATCRRCQSAGMETSWKKSKKGLAKAERIAQRRRSDAYSSGKHDREHVTTRCMSEELRKTEPHCLEKEKVVRNGGRSPNSKQSLRYTLGSCLGSRSHTNKRDAASRQKRRFSFSLPGALVNLFRKGCPPTLRSTSSQTDPCPLEDIASNSRIVTPCRSPYVVRALPPLPNEACVPCGQLGAADNISGTSDDSDRKSMDYAASIEKVKDCGWYWGPVSGETAERLLANEPDGSFIVRDSSDEHYIFSLTFKLNGLVRHVRIEHDQGNFSFGCLQKFHSNTIVDFIENAVEHSRSGRYLFFLHRRPVLGPMRVQLLHPVSRFKQVQSLQHLCRFSILKTIRRDFIDSLPLPVRLKAYLNTPHYYSEELANISRKGHTIHTDLSSQRLSFDVEEPHVDTTTTHES
ncbi:uncharacterized protein LOC135385829 [Ornithodoros turicata]